MYLVLKKSEINEWWVAKEHSKMAFANISPGKVEGRKLVVVGYREEQRSIWAPELMSSSDYITKITAKGVITEKGTFYPFKEAHALYLRFLIEAIKDNTVVATKWEFIRYKNIMTADVLQN